MDPLIQVAVSTFTVIVAAVIAIVVGSRKGLADVEARSDSETARLVSALEGRARILDKDLEAAKAEIVTLRAEVAALRVETAALKAELAIEKRITAGRNGT